MRKEKDSIGYFDIPDDAYGSTRPAPSTTSGEGRHDGLFVTAYLQVKKAAALANGELGFLDPERAGGHRLRHRRPHRRRFVRGHRGEPSGGAGTSLNMNINEVVANHALALSGRGKGDYGHIHPLDHVNLHQSTNDTYPSAPASPCSYT